MEIRLRKLAYVKFESKKLWEMQFGIEHWNKENRKYVSQ